MTNDDIIKAAFKVWGRELYRTTSLAKLAGELGVSKPALYRHFEDKNALLEAMYTAFFDECAGFIKNGFELAANAPSGTEGYRILIRTIAEYYVRYRESFVFSLIQVYNCRDKDDANREFSIRGVNFGQLARERADFHPSLMQLIMSTLVFCVAGFHQRNSRSGENPSNEAINRVLGEIEDRIYTGLKLDAEKISALDYERLEKQAAGVVWEDTEDDALLKAVAEAVAEAGPWDASMEMVARRSGLSKSGLYAHFKNKQDMLGKLFLTEFTRMANLVKPQIESSEESEVQLYLAIISIVNYLRSRPDILVAIDWIKTRRLELGKEIPGQLSRIIGSIKLEVVKKQDQRMLVEIAQWILFMTVNTLVWRSSGSIATEITNESFRVLFRFISLGLEGLHL